MLDSPKNTVLVIGSGFVGTLTTIRLLHHAKEPMRIILLEKTEKQRSGGLAFGESSTGWEHLLNIQAGRISAFREHPDDFLHWIREEANRSEWPKEWRKMNYHVSSAVPRKIYHRYIDDRLKQAENNAAPGVVLCKINGEAVDLIEKETTVIVTIEDQTDGVVKRKEFEADQVIIATGHIEFVLPPFAKAVEHDPHFARNQFSQKGQEVIQHLKIDETALIVGTGLSAFDAVLSLLAHGHQGPIILCSREGLLHFVYPENHLHEIFQVRRPPFLEQENLTVEKVKAGVLEEFDYQIDLLKRERSDIAEVILSERILKAWEPYVVELVECLSTEDVKQLLKIYMTLIVTSRIGTVPEIGGVIAERMKEREGELAQVSIVKGDIQKMTPTGDGQHISVRLLDTEKNEVICLEVGAGICSVGQESDYTRIASPLWRKLIDVHGSAIPHKKTGRGIEVGEHGELINAKGKSSRRVYAVGPMRQGDEIQRRGRLGGFVFSIGTVRNQAFITAVVVLRRLAEEKSGKWSSISPLNFDIMPEEISDWIADEALKRESRKRTRTEVQSLRETLQNLVAAALHGDLLVENVRSLSTINPAERQLFEKRISLAEMELNSELYNTGLEAETINFIMKEVSNQAERIALQQLTDISRLAAKPDLQAVFRVMQKNNEF